MIGATRPAGTIQSDASATIWRFLSDGALDPGLSGSGGTGTLRFDLRAGNVATAANALFPHGNAVYASGGVFDEGRVAVDVVVWRLLP